MASEPDEKHKGYATDQDEVCRLRIKNCYSDYRFVRGVTKF